MSTPTFRAEGALPVTPVTLTDEVTAAPASGMLTSAVFSKTLPPGSPPPPGRAPTLTPAQACSTARTSGLPAPYSSVATATVPARAPA
ncbi:hypothetical protein BG846_04424 [Streptomyces fradiae ATCC 10745 = DSM 40063]|uniref:Uncharacterized protein n=1 Tax=Streptomyces fradiae ATCC 10745 = DSM 40063 TaxID=1319510 RepID=A0A1Y2NSN7_STRFR|nr:hypothetical protein BG846_04424 [Streptomyces fradiae ATCC 10745 = DSM 40063]